MLPSLSACESITEGVEVAFVVVDGGRVPCSWTFLVACATDVAPSGIVSGCSVVFCNWNCEFTLCPNTRWPVLVINWFSEFVVNAPSRV